MKFTPLRLSYLVSRFCLPTVIRLSLLHYVLLLHTVQHRRTIGPFGWFSGGTPPMTLTLLTVVAVLYLGKCLTLILTVGLTVGLTVAGVLVA